MVLAEQAPSLQSQKVIDLRAGTADNDAEVFVLSPEEVQEAINNTLARAGCSLQQLREEASSGDWSSESNWHLWFCISPFVE